MSRLIYVAHPYGGKEENKTKVENIIKQLIKKDENSDCVFISPIHTMGYLYKEVSYIKGMEMCVELLDKCDELWLYEGWQDSKGCCMEYTHANARGIKVVLLPNSDIKPIQLYQCERCGDVFREINVMNCRGTNHYRCDTCKWTF